MTTNTRYYCALIENEDGYQARFCDKDLSLTDEDTLASWIIEERAIRPICDFLVKVNNFGDVTDRSVILGIQRILKLQNT